MAIHNRFLRSNETVCENPSKLDEMSEPLIVDYNPADQEACVECRTLLFVHNQRQYEKEELSQPLEASKKDSWWTNPFLLVSFFWLSLFFLVWAVFFRG